MNRDLEIYYGDCRVGLFGITEQAEYYIAYDDEWMSHGFPVSVHLPLESKIHRGKPVEYFIENLLPEAGIRLAIAQHHGVSANNYFSLMLHIGRDCAGAFSLGAPQSAGEYKELTNDALKDLLLHLPQYPFASNRAGASFSLAGAQNKIPLFQENRTFYLPVLGAASNCIVKTPISRVKCSVMNELFCMKLADKALRHVAAVDYLPMDSVSSLVVHRYDRRREKKVLTRIPQEDFCQLAKLPSSMKYECDGGPGFAECAHLIRTYSSIPAPDIIQLVRWAMFNLCIGNMDAHAKNLSLCVIDGSLRLAPFYDLISTLQYPELNGDLAMSIGGRRNPAKIGRKQWEALAATLQLPTAFVLKEVQTTASKVIDHLPDIEGEISPIVDDSAKSFVHDLRQNILQRSMNLLRQLKR